jgi:hypothetical protein
VQPEDLYRYDRPSTRKLKTALNYRLNQQQANAFVSPLFEEAYGSELAMSRQLYLSLDDLARLRHEARICFHGNEHRLWSSLNNDELQAELAPPPTIQALLSDDYVLSIPFGMEGAWNDESLLAARGKARGAFTMMRHLDHSQNGDFCWLHRFDQADLFMPDNTLKIDVLEALKSRLG